MIVDVIASAPKYRAHLDPVWAALPPEARGRRVALGLRSTPSTDTRRKAALVAGYLDMRTARRWGYRKIALLEHGVGQSYLGWDWEAVPGGKDRDPVGLFLSPNETAASRDARRYPRAKVEVVGSTVLDTLPKREPGPGPVIALTWHWSYARVPEMRSAWEHFKPALASLAQRFRLLGHAHPQAEGMVLGEYRRLGIEYEPDYRRVFERSDVLVADNTSALYEFASTGRPTVVLNAPWFRRGVNHGLRFWQAATVGVQVDDPAMLDVAVTEALIDSEARRTAREAALAIVYAYRSGAAQRAAAALVEWLQ